MTKKDYELIAETFAHHRRMYGGRTDSVTVEIIRDMAEALEKHDPLFNKSKFLKACGLEA